MSIENTCVRCRCNLSTEQHAPTCERRQQAIDHYNKYAALCAKYGIKFDDDCVKLFNVPTVAKLRELYLADAHLNNIPLNIFDSYSSMIIYRKGLSLAEGVCIAKHALIYHVLKIDPPK